jgi:hypothetical protein
LVLSYSSQEKSCNLSPSSIHVKPFRIQGIWSVLQVFVFLEFFKIPPFYLKNTPDFGISTDFSENTQNFKMELCNRTIIPRPPEYLSRSHIRQGHWNPKKSAAEHKWGLRRSRTWPREDIAYISCGLLHKSLS